jgi:Fe-S oxidoreductase
MPTTERNKNVFNAEACNLCGECFHRCPELNLPLALAKEEISGLINGKTEGHVLSHCTTCFSCNHYCPNECKPYQLILERWNDLYHKRGAPPIYRFVCPTMDKSIWHMLDALLKPEEIAWIREWTGRKPAGDILLIGNYVHLLPFIAGGSRLLDLLTPVDLIDHWECGAYLYQGGYLDIVKNIAEKCKKDFQKWKVGTVIPMIDSVHWMMTDVIPHEMSVDLGIRVENFHDWLLNRIKGGEIELPKKLGMKVTLHDNCYSKGGGVPYWERPRRLLEIAGCDIIEMKHNRENSLCCGFGAGASWVRPITILFDIMDVARKKFEEAEETGAEALVSYCGGCMYLLWTAKELYEKKIDTYHLVEVIRMAMGETIRYPEDHQRRAWDLIAIITYHMIMSLWGKPFRIERDSLENYPPAPRKFFLLRILRKLFDIPLVRFLYKKGFRIMVPMLKSKRRF